MQVATDTGMDVPEKAEVRSESVQVLFVGEPEQKREKGESRDWGRSVGGLEDGKVVTTRKVVEGETPYECKPYESCSLDLAYCTHRNPIRVFTSSVRIQDDAYLFVVYERCSVFFNDRLCVVPRIQQH
ncbi:hypothetical protein QR680_016655 [Steinernema hermaphroditum]|uniref:Uncharacterized protein n=1 Tax=Steinernema hermaphroditum TaxID=289476 RepID=A0AA39HC92_9BILA|nr:hypothetical protein QR680_016655 [Steinernema hermaphroditum]